MLTSGSGGTVAVTNRASKIDKL